VGDINFLFILGHDSLLFVHTIFTASSGIIVLITSYASTNYFTKSRPFLLALLVGSSLTASIWYSIFQIIIDNNLLTLSQLSYIWMSFGVLLFLSSFLFLDWKFSILNLPYKFQQELDETPAAPTNNTSSETKWYTNIYQRNGIWEYLTSPLYILVVLFLSFLMMTPNLLSVTWYPWVYFINDNNKEIGMDHCFGIGCINVMPLHSFMDNVY
ncbi:unnamed protein product, partial [Rotaria sp. Silwood1]